jgi:hypothetical protein
MIEGLQIQSETQNGKVYYEPVVLTVSGVSKFRDDEISFQEISGFWSLKYEPRAYVYSSAPRAEGTNPGDGKLHIGDVAKFGLNINPKSTGNSFYHNISSVMPSEGEPPIERVQSQGQPAPQSGGSWASDTGSSDSAPFVDKWDLKDIHIRKAQAENILSSALRIRDEERMLKVLKAMGFKDVDEAIDAVANGWNLLRRGLPIEFPVAVSDMEEEEGVPDFADDNLDEDVENVSWD